MPKPVTISAKTITLILGVVVAVFIFLSLAVLDQSDKDAEEGFSSPEAKPTTSQVIKTVHHTSSQLLIFFNRFGVEK